MNAQQGEYKYQALQVVCCSAMQPDCQLKHQTFPASIVKGIFKQQQRFCAHEADIVPVLPRDELGVLLQSDVTRFSHLLIASEHFKSCWHRSAIDPRKISCSRALCTLLTWWDMSVCT